MRYFGFFLIQAEIVGGVLSVGSRDESKSATQDGDRIRPSDITHSLKQHR
jgi:hypothetical protein